MGQETELKKGGARAIGPLPHLLLNLIFLGATAYSINILCFYLEVYNLHAVSLLRCDVVRLGLMNFPSLNVCLFQIAVRRLISYVAPSESHSFHSCL